MLTPIRIAVDAMGGDNSPEKVIRGISLHSKKKETILYNIFGDEDKISEFIKKYPIKQNYKLFDTKEKISFYDRTVRLFIVKFLRLDKPALSALWPNKIGMNVVLDLGANVECNEKNLIDFSLMGAALHKSLFPHEISKVSLLNIGSEEIKGNSTIKNTYKELSNKKNPIYDFCGYIEGNQIMDGKVNVIVTDGFTGNVALKTAEGTANFITNELKNALSGNIIGKISSFLNIKNLKKFKEKLDPRLYNGAILLGLNSPVIKSHGGTDYIGFANSLGVCEKIIEGKLIEKIKNNIL